MAVPVTGNFDMFGTGSNTCIAGAMHNTGDTITGVTTFNALISASTAGKFDYTYAGAIQFPDLDISSSNQFRGYPVDPAVCRFVWVDDTVDSSRYGLRYKLASNQIIDAKFNTMFGTPYGYGGNTGVIYSVCSSLSPSTWDSQTNTLVNLGGLVVDFPDGGDCYITTDCVWTAPPTPTPTVTPTITTTPTPTVTPTIVSWVAERNDGQAVDYVGLQQGYTASDEVLIDDNSGICWTLGTESTIAPNYSIISSCITPTPTPTPTFTPTPTITTFAATCYQLLEEGSSAVTVTLRTATGVTKNITLQPGVLTYYCVTAEPTSSSPTFTATSMGTTCTSDASCNTTPTPTPTVTPTVTPTITPTPTVSPTYTPTVTPTPTTTIAARPCYASAPVEYIRLINISSIGIGFALELTSAGGTLNGTCWEVIDNNYTGTETPIDANVVQVHYSGCSSCTPPPVTPTPTPTATPTPTPTVTPTVVTTPTPTPTPTPTLQSYIVENSDGSQYEYISISSGYTTNDIVAITGYGLECWTIGGASLIAPTVTVSGPCTTPTPTFTPTPTPVTCVSTLVSNSTTSSTDACNATTGTWYTDTGTLSNATRISKASDCSTYPTARYFAEGSDWRYWNGSSFTTSGNCDAY